MKTVKLSLERVLSVGVLLWRLFHPLGIHAREWVSPAAAFYLIDQLLKTPGVTTDIEWRIMPMVNPDGYVFSHSSVSPFFTR